MNVQEAKNLMYEWVTSPSLRKHCESVAASMRYMANHFNEDPILWEVVGLLHDFDYERFPTLENHPYKGVEYLRSIGIDEVICRAILSHSHETGVTRDSLMEKCLFAVDELSGFVGACVLVRPDKDIMNLEVNSVKKKLKTKEFAAKVSREDIALGAELLNMDIDELIGHVIEAQKMNIS